MNFDVSDVGLDTDKEDIDATAVLPDSRIVLSTLDTAQTLKQFGNTRNSLDEELILIWTPYKRICGAFPLQLMSQLYTLTLPAILILAQ